MCRRMFKFPTTSTHESVVLLTKDDVCNGQLVEIYHEGWETVVANLKEVVVEYIPDIQDGAADDGAASDGEG
jgi:hypothetical protein